MKGLKSINEILAELEKEGYSILEGLISSDQTTVIRDELKCILADEPFGKNNFLGERTKRLHSLFAKLRSIDDLALKEEILEVAEELLGDVILGASVATQIFPGESEQPFHFDDGIYPLPREFREVKLGVMWALDDFTEDNGGTVIIPRSHGKREHSSLSDLGERKVTVMPRGSALLYLGSLWHAAGANTSGEDRLGVILQYVESWLRPQDSHLISVQINEAMNLKPKLRGLLGYSMRQPFLGYVDGQDPMHLLHERK